MKYTVSEAINDYINHISAVDIKSLATISAYKNDLNKYKEYLKSINIEFVNEITIKEIQNFINDLNCKASTINHYIVVIRCFHNYICEYHSEIHNPVIYLKNKKVGRKLPKLISNEDLENILSYEMDNKDLQLFHLCILELLYGCGLRVSECCNLTMNNIHLHDKTIRVLGKGDKERIVLINDHCINLLNTYIYTIRINWNKKKLPFLFINKIGNKLNRQYVSAMIKQICSYYNIEHKHISAHSFRHTFATHMLSGGSDLRVLQELLGHQDISTTQIYTHIQNDELKKNYLKAHPFNKK